MTKPLSLFAGAALGIALATAAHADRVSVLVFDASGSMWNRVEGDLSRIEVARDVIGDYFATRDSAVPLSVIAYGHNRRGDCADIEVVVPMGQTAPGALEDRLRALMPRGMTPLTDSLALARGQIPPTAEAADIILVTDGLETCGGDPCALAAELAAEGIDIRAHVVGFGLTRIEVEALSCITDQTGGMLFETNSGAELADALRQVSLADRAPAPEVASEPVGPALLSQHFVFSEAGSGMPRGLMEWRAESAGGTVIALGSTEGTQQSIAGISVELPAGTWRIVAEGEEGRAERLMELTQCCGSHGVPFTGHMMTAQIPPLGQVQAGQGARLPYEITHPGSGNLGGTPYRIIATGPEGSLSADQVVRRDLITSRGPGLTAAATGALAPGAYRLIVAIARDGGYQIAAERSFEAVERPEIGVLGPDHAAPGARIELWMGGGYASHYVFAVVDANDRNIGQGYALYTGPGGQLTAPLTMPGTEGVYDLVIRRGGGGPDRDEILARRPITIGAAPDPTQGALQQDAIAAVPATFRLPAGLPDIPVSWDGIPLDPDMSPEAWAPHETGLVISGEFEPGNWRITAWAPGEVEFTADVAIFPGQANDFTLSVVDLSLDGALEGGWRVWAIPPRDVADPPMGMAQIELRLTDERLDYIGTIAPEAAMGPNATPGDLNAVIIEFENLYIDFAQPGILTDPFRLALAPQGVGYVGTMTMGAHAMPVAFWPVAAGQDMTLWQDAAYGPAESGDGDLNDIGFTCSEPRCDVIIDGVSATLEQGWSMTPPAWTSATAGAHPLDWPRVDFFGRDGAMLHLNPHQWLASDGPCMASEAGGLCLWQDGPAHAMAAAISLAMSLRLIERDAALTIDPPPVQHAEGPGSMAIEPDDGSFFSGHGPYLAGAEVYVFAQRGQNRRPGDSVVVLGAGLAPVPGATSRWLDDHRAGVLMPDAPGLYSLAVFDGESASLRAVTEIEVAATPEPVFTRYNPNPRTGRSYGLVVRGRMALNDRIAIRTTAGDTVIEVSLYDALRGEIRLPEGAFGAMELVYLADDAVLQRAAINVGGPPALSPAGGSDGPAEIIMTGAMTPGGQVEVSLRGMIPSDLGTVGFIRAGSPDLAILETGSRVSPDEITVMVKVPEGHGPWALRLVDQNLIRVAEILPETLPAADPASSAHLTPVILPEGMNAGELFDILLPGLNAE